jgi:hypothetical protein
MVEPAAGARRVDDEGQRQQQRQQQPEVLGVEQRDVGKEAQRELLVQAQQHHQHGPGQQHQLPAQAQPPCASRPLAAVEICRVGGPDGFAH